VRDLSFSLFPRVLRIQVFFSSSSMCQPDSHRPAPLLFFLSKHASCAVPAVPPGQELAAGSPVPFGVSDAMKVNSGSAYFISNPVVPPAFRSSWQRKVEKKGRCTSPDHFSFRVVPDRPPLPTMPADHREMAWRPYLQVTFFIFLFLHEENESDRHSPPRPSPNNA